MARTDLKSPVSGTMWKVECSVGDQVKEGDTLMVLESMKMEIPVEAEVAGTVVEFSVEAGVAVDEDQVLCVIET